MRPFPDDSPVLQQHRWPYVGEFDGFTDDFTRFINLAGEEQKSALKRLRSTADEHGKVLHNGLAGIYAYRLGYVDSPTYLKADDLLETKLESAKIVLERELYDHWLPAPQAQEVTNQADAARHLRDLAERNVGVNHPLFDYLATTASSEAMKIFLLNDVIRNEVVDDEVAHLIFGHQGLLKSAAAINLFDECGRGKLQHFHTYWLRLLLEEIGWDDLSSYRKFSRPWFTAITSNVFMMLLTRSPYKSAAYGHFITTEGWVPPHFEKLLEGMRRVGLDQGQSELYFTAHVTLDPTHTEELIRAIEVQVPPLDPNQCQQIVDGAHLAIAGATKMYDYMLDYLSRIDRREPAASDAEALRAILN